MLRAAKVCFVLSLLLVFAFLGFAPKAFAAPPNASVKKPVASPAAPTAGQAVTFTIQVNGNLSAFPTGTVDLYDGATYVATGSLTQIGATTDSQATIPVASGFASGAHSFTGQYAGDSTYTNCTAGSPCVSPALNITITMNTATIAVTSVTPANTATDPFLGEMLSITATVTDSGASGTTISGIVNFFDGTTWIGSKQLVAATGSAQAVLDISTLGAGTHASIKAQYLGNSNFTATALSAAYGTAPVIKKRPTSVTINVPAQTGTGVVTNISIDTADTGTAPVGTKGSFTQTGSLLTGARSGQASTLLPDGSILVIGGTDNTGSVFRNIEKYSYISETFSGTSSCSGAPCLNTPRTGATATLLQDGTVLITGGYNGSAILGTAELYDPVAGTITDLSAESMVHPRMNHTATLLPNGKVLIAGGITTGGTPEASVEVYNPAASSGSKFSAAGFAAMNHPRAGHSATLLAGGTAILMAGGDTDAGGNTAELYLVTGASSTDTAHTLTSVRSFHSATLLPDGLVVLIGGETASTPLATVEFYDPAVDNFFSVAGTLPDLGAGTGARQRHTARLLPDGRLLIVGGSSSFGDSSAGQTSYLQDMSTAILYVPPFDPQGGITTFTSTDPSAGSDTVNAGDCGTFVLSGTGTSTCHPSITPDAVTGSHTVNATYADSGSVHLGNSGTTPLNVGETVTITAVPVTKTYDTGTTASGNPTVTGSLGTDVVCTGGTQTTTQHFLSANASAAAGVVTPTATLVPDAVTIHDTTCAGATHTSSYFIQYVNATNGTIDPLPLVSTSALTANPKTYDATLAEPDVNMSCTYAGQILGSDTVTCAATAGTFDTAPVGAAHTVTATLTISGASANNYTLGALGTSVFTTSGSATGVSIYTRVITPALTAANKTYDTTATELAADMSCTFGTQILGADVVTCAIPADGTFDSASAGATHTVTATANMAGADAGNYTLGAPNTTTSVATGPATATNVSIYTFPVTSTITANNKDYDATLAEPDAAMTCTPNGVLPADAASVNCTASAGAFDSASAGGAHTVTATVTLGGAKGGNYTFGAANTTVSAPGTGTVSPVTIYTKAITAALTAANKTYNANAVELVASMSCSFGGQIIGSDNVTCSVPADGTFDSPNAGAGHTVDATVNMGGTAAGNYTLGAPNTTASVTTAPASATNVSIYTLPITPALVAANKTYDATSVELMADMSCNFGAQILGADVVTCAPSANGTFNSPNAGAGRTVTATIAMGGASAGNYTLGGSNTTTSVSTGPASVGGVSIYTLPVTANFTANAKTYDTNVTEAPANMSCSANGVLPADSGNVSCTPSGGTFDTPGAGATHTVTATVTLGGSAGANYTFGAPNTTVSAPTTANATNVSIYTRAITPALTAANRNYDTTTTELAASMSCSFGGQILGADVVTCAIPADGAFDGPNAGVHTVTATANMGGSDSGNYTLGAANTTTSVTTAPATATGVSIYTLPITATLTAANKVYNASAAEPDSSMSCLFTGVLPAEAANVTCTPTSGAFDSIHVVGATTVTATVNLGGPAGGNYTLGGPNTTTSVTSTTATAPANITTAPLTVTPDGLKSKVYGAVFSAFTGVVAGLQGSDAVTVVYDSTGAPAAAAVGAYNITVNTVTFTSGVGTDYSVTNNVAVGGLTVGAAPLTITPDGSKAKVYGAVFSGFTGVVTGLQTQNGDAVTVTYDSLGAPAAAGVANYDITVANVAFTSGTAANYTITQNTATAGLAVNQAPLTVTPDGGKSKVYGSVFSAFTGVVTGLQTQNGDAVTVTYDSPGAAGTATVGSYNITVANIAFTTGSAANYAITQNTATNGLTITPAPLTVTAKNIAKVYQTLYTFDGTEFTATGLVNADTVTSVTLSSTGAPASAAFGLYDILISNAVGTGLTNYTITYQKGTMTVGQADTSTGISSGLTVAINDSGGTFTFTVGVASSTAGVPTGTITFTDNGTTIGTKPLDGTGAASLSGVVLTASTTPHAIKAAYGGDVNYKGSSVTVYVTAAPKPTPIVAGNPASPTTPVTYNGAPTSGGSLSSTNLVNNCTVQSAVVAVTSVTNCTATLDKTLNPGDSGTLTIKINTSAGTVASLHNNPAAPLGSLYTWSFALPAVVFIGLVPVGDMRKKLLRRKVLAWLGLVAIISVLLLAAGCGGGGFDNPNKLGAVGSLNRTQAGSYTAIVTYTDKYNKTQVLASMPFTVN
jgi:hypothetical protein